MSDHGMERYGELLDLHAEHEERQADEAAIRPSFPGRFFGRLPGSMLNQGSQFTEAEARLLAEEDAQRINEADD